MSVVVDGKKQEIEIKDKYDALLKQLGMDKMLGSKMNLLKAPMPGLVLNILVKEGDNIKKGDSLLVLEAMKMENNIKAAGDGVVKKVNVQVKQAVEKNQVLIEME
jgi:biotin carboxyl carrier protein